LHLQTFFGGLEAKVGAPHANVRRSMEREHKESADSQDEFTTPNYHVRTTPSIEWVFVTAPETHAEPFPTEQVLLSSPEKMRKPLSSAELSARLEGFNSRLRAVGHAELMLEEAYGGRLYTGPMFVKYIDSLRGFGNFGEHCSQRGGEPGRDRAASRRAWERACPGGVIAIAAGRRRGHGDERRRTAWH